MEESFPINYTAQFLRGKVKNNFKGVRQVECNSRNKNLTEILGETSLTLPNIHVSSEILHLWNTMSSSTIIGHGFKTDSQGKNATN